MSAPTRLGIAELEARLGVARTTVAAWVRAGRLPRPHYLAGRRRWWLHEIEEWEAQHVTQTYDGRTEP